MAAVAKRPRVVIVGAGFGGLWAARSLAGKGVDVTLIDRNNYHTFFPLLYQVAAAEIDPGDIAYPVRKILRKMKNVEFFLGEVTSVDFIAQVLSVEGHEISYDYLILATGSTTQYFDVPGAAEFTYPLRTLEEAIALRNHILSRFEQAVQEQDTGRRGRLLTFTIVGGGPTGVEFAGALQELICGPLLKDFPTLDFAEVRVLLLEAQERLLPGQPDRLQAYTLKRLRKMGVGVRLGGLVGQITPEAVHLESGETIPTESVVWTAGMRGDPLVKRWGLETNRGGQAIVRPGLFLAEYPQVYVVGDLASMQGAGESLPMVAPVAVQQAETAAANILRQIKGEEQQPFTYHDLGTMAVIGRNAAVANLFGRWAFTGFIAWVVWLVVHLARLIGFRNRIVVLTNWAWNYLFFERAVRLILP